ncbi:MAG: hypothetical protein ETSY2_22905 [Candidatus Entotheonella gemina]|uniref:PKD domain-containing protein n=1 Tax=Candidatus Entotheonella gemina TaxID=1429439 RepID=W4M5I1_9BACT|nr:MAG: hypothetical protein ETSY2_22905 [Candidatus Entotheonella gemina]
MSRPFPWTRSVTVLAALLMALTLTQCRDPSSQEQPAATQAPLPTNAFSITAPRHLSLIRDATVTVTGTLSHGDFKVEVNGTSALVTGTTFRAPDIAVPQGSSRLTVRAEHTGGQVLTQSITVIRDTTAPRVVIDSPAEGAVLTEAAVTITGRVLDAGPAAIDGDPIEVTVNGMAATVVQHTFEARHIALTPGANTLTVAARDQAGNRATATFTLSHQPPVPGTPRLLAISGQGQASAINTPLADPLIVAVIDAQEQPIPNHLVFFEVAANNGTLHQAGTQDVRRLMTRTDAQGQARVEWTLGSRAGQGLNRVIVRAQDISGPLRLSATGLPAAPAHLVVDDGNTQTGLVNQTLPKPVTVVVTDAGHNRLSQVPVVLTVASGGGAIDGQPSVTRHTDMMGRAVVHWTLGPQAGISNQHLTATIAGHFGRPARLIASAALPGDPQATAVSGVVLDNTNVPIEGVTVSLADTALHVQTDAQGQFHLQPAPIGHLHLHVDGSTAKRQGTWPSLDYEIDTLPGQTLTVGQPIYLLPLDVARGLRVDQHTGGTITLDEIPGFALHIAPGSATFADSRRQGVVSATVVHADKVPMVPNFGQQPALVLTLQPAGVHFDPPAALTLPNLDGLQPGEITELYSFDHDAGRFLAMGTGTVSADGTVIRSDAGVGVIKGGWHCAGNPSQVGDCCEGESACEDCDAPRSCTACERCQSDSCVVDESKQGRDCLDDGNVCTRYTCRGSACDVERLTQSMVEGQPCQECQNGELQPKENGSLCQDDACHLCHEGDCVPKKIVSVEALAQGQEALIASRETPVDFTVQVEDEHCTALKYAWDFGDGTSSTAQNPSHRYAEPGEYTATVQVTCDDTCDDSTATVSVTIPCDVQILTAGGRKVRVKRAEAASIQARLAPSSFEPHHVEWVFKRETREVSRKPTETRLETDVTMVDGDTAYQVEVEVYSDETTVACTATAEIEVEARQGPLWSLQLGSTLNITEDNDPNWSMGLPRCNHNTIVGQLRDRESDESALIVPSPKTFSDESWEDGYEVASVHDPGGPNDS